MRRPEWLPAPEKLLAFAGRYKYVLLVAAAGLVLLLWPGGGEGTPADEDSQGLSGQEEDFSVEALEERLADALSRVDGAGEVSVLLTVERGMERVLAADRREEQSQGERVLEESTVILSTDSGEEAVLVTQRYPTFQGALVICPGGEDPAVRLALTQAVAALTGLGSDRITVCKGS